MAISRTSHPIHCKNQPLYFANFPHHPIYRVYRHRQKSTPKPNHLTNHDSAKRRAVPAPPREGQRQERPRQSREQSTNRQTKKRRNKNSILCNYTQQNPQITQISPISRVIIPNQTKQLTTGALPTFAYTSVAPTTIVCTTIA